MVKNVRSTPLQD